MVKYMNKVCCTRKRALSKNVKKGNFNFIVIL